MSLVLKDDCLTGKHTVGLCNLSQECIECCRPEGCICAQSAQSLLLDYQQVNGEQLITRKVLFLKACDLTHLLSD